MEWKTEFELLRSTPSIDAKSILSFLHRVVHINHGVFADEYTEQLMAASFIAPDAQVLELGGNIGRNSCIIAALLNNSNNLVVLESEPVSARKLEDNKNLNGFSFQVEPMALSSQPLMQKEWDTLPSVSPLPEGWNAVNTISWPELQKKHAHLKFDTLVADCEGALYYILQDEPDFLCGFTCVVIENDFTCASHMHFVHKKLVEAGLRAIYTKPHYHPTFPSQECVAVFWQTWKK